MYKSAKVQGEIGTEKGVRSFEDLRLFQTARELSNDIWRLTRNESASRDYAFTDQIRRSALSILSNIAEGFERNSRKEFVRFLSIAKGSCGELRAQLLFALDQNYIPADGHKRLQKTCF
jgi:four helix bundle protein